MVAPDGELDPRTAVTVGRVLTAQGVQGEIKVEPLTDFPERFKPGARVWLRGEPVRVRASRWRGRYVYLRLEGIDDRGAAEGLRDVELMAPQAMALPDADVFYQHDIVGLKVETEAGEALGRVESIFSTGANDVYVVRGEQGELLLPAIEDVVKRIDLVAGRLIVELLPGLEFRQAGPAKRAPVRQRRKRPSP
jgi:16S rRNA processing protein RimM